MSQSPVFIVTTGRTGSTMLSGMLRNHPTILSLSEVLSSLTSRALSDRVLDGPTFAARMTTQGPVLRAMFKSGIRQGEILYEQGLHGDLPLSEVPPLALVTLPFLDERPLDAIAAVVPSLHARGNDRLENHMRYLFDWLTDHFGKSLWIERSGDSILYVERLAEMFPDARFVHLYRDGRAVALSMRNHSDFRAKVSYCNLLKKLGIDVFQSSQTYGVAAWHAWIEAVLVHLLPIRTLTDANVSAEACAKYWDHASHAGMKMLDALDENRVHHVSYEKLVQTPEAELKQLTDFIGAEAPSDWLADASALAEVREENWHSLSADEIKALESACGSSLARLGYK